MPGILERIGEGTIRFVGQVGSVAILLGRIFSRFPEAFQSSHLVVEQMWAMGVASLPLIVITSVFTGAVATWQTHYQLISGFSGISLSYVGYAVAKMMLIELGPVLTALVVAGRVGSSIAAELGTMKVTEQIDALESLAIDPIRYLALPRMVAGLIMLPMLAVFADFMGIMGGYGVALAFLGISSYEFVEGLRLFFYVRDVLVGLLKALVFGGVIALMGCYWGFLTEGGAAGVGRSAIRAFVSSAVLVMISNYLIAAFMF